MNHPLDNFSVTNNNNKLIDDSIDDIKEDNYGMDSLNRTLLEFENFLNKYI